MCCAADHLGRVTRVSADAAGTAGDPSACLRRGVGLSLFRTRHLGGRSILAGVALLKEALVDQRTVIGGREVWAVIKASAERRLGKPLLKAYMFLALFGIVVVAVSIVVMHL